MAGQGTTTVDFGTGQSWAEKVVTGQTAITSTALVEAWIHPTSTSDHNVDEHAVVPMRVKAGNIVASNGFTIYAEHCDQQKGLPEQQVRESLQSETYQGLITTPTAAKYAATVTAAGSWTSSANTLGAPDAVTASVALAGFGSTSDATITNYGFSIPSGAPIYGVAVTLTCGGGGTPGVITSSLNLRTASTNGNNKAASDPWPTSGLGPINYGGPTSDTAAYWGFPSQLTDVDVNSSGFGVRWGCTNNQGTAQSVFTDAIGIIVYYGATGDIDRDVYRPEPGPLLTGQWTVAWAWS